VGRRVEETDGGDVKGRKSTGTRASAMLYVYVAEQITPANVLVTGLLSPQLSSDEEVSVSLHVGHGTAAS